MVGRVKFQVLGKNGWVTAYCKPELVERNTHAFNDAGYVVRVNGSDLFHFPKKREIAA
jgi:hypothetical protein